MIHWFLALLSIHASWAAFEIPGFELVYTAPVQTVLTASDLRDPVTVWSELIDGAKKKIDLGHMYASGKEGEPLDQILERLEAAGARGVKIRLLLEKKMQRASVEETVERLKKIKGLELRVIEFGKVSHDGIVHSKYMVVDGKKAFLGSQNFDWRALKHIHETGLLISHRKIVQEIQSIFDFDWKAAGTLAKGGKVKPTRSKPLLAKLNQEVELVASPNSFLPRGIPDSQTALPRSIGKAQKEIRIQVLDYAPLSRDGSYYGLIDQALREAQARKVKVKLMVSHWNQEKGEIEYLKSLAVLPNVEVKIVNIPQTKGEFISYARVNHSKFMVIDNKISWVGTSNWTGGYLDKSRNIEIILQNEKLAQRLSALHEQMWNSEYAALVDPSKDYPKPKKSAE